MQVLQEGDPPRQTKVRVRPLVYLVGQRDEDGEEEEETLNTVRALDAGFVSEIKLEGVRRQQHHRYHEVIAVGFDEVMAGDGGRIDVVLTERSDERL